MCCFKDGLTPLVLQYSNYLHNAVILLSYQSNYQLKKLMVVFEVKFFQKFHINQCYIYYLINLLIITNTQTHIHIYTHTHTHQHTQNQHQQRRDETHTRIPRRTHSLTHTHTLRRTMWFQPGAHREQYENSPCLQRLSRSLLLSREEESLIHKIFTLLCQFNIFWNVGCSSC